MKKHLLRAYYILFLLGNSVFSNAQSNLVPNGSFENHSSCPGNQGNLYLATGWTSYRNSPDYFNVCSVNYNSEVPSNAAGWQYPASGNGYAGLVIRGLANGAERREYMGCQLLSQLVIGQKYYVSLKASLCNIDSALGYDCASNNIGFRFSTVSASSVAPYPMFLNSAVVNNTTIVTDTLNWKLITGSFVSDSTYKYMIIGNFFDDVNTSQTCYFNTSYKFSYYFIDDVILSTDSTLTNVGTHTKRNSELLIYPLIANDKIFIEQNSSEDINICMHNLLGEPVIKQYFHNEGQRHTINIEALSPGIYTLLIRTKNEIVSKKIIKQ